MCHDSSLIVLKGKNGVIEVIVVIVVRSLRFSFFFAVVAAAVAVAAILLFANNQNSKCANEIYAMAHGSMVVYCVFCTLCIWYNDNRHKFSNSFLVNSFTWQTKEVSFTIWWKNCTTKLLLDEEEKKRNQNKNKNFHSSIAIAGHTVYKLFECIVNVPSSELYKFNKQMKNENKRRKKRPKFVPFYLDSNVGKHLLLFMNHESFEFAFFFFMFCAPHIKVVLYFFSVFNWYFSFTWRLVELGAVFIVKLN